VIDKVVLGCALFGGLGSLPDLRDRGIDRSVAFELMSAAWDLGIRRFDTADAYGGGMSEQWIGQWASATGHPVQVTTKTFNAMAQGADTGLAPSRIRRQLESSLERLSRDRIDLYLAHEWDAAVPAEATISTFEELVAERKITAYGYSNVSAEQLRSIGSNHALSAVQNSYSLLRRVDEERLIPECRRAGIEYEAYSPLAGGWLTGKNRPGEPLSSDSRMALVPEC
jgi:aryl-alcohol dehydrogenase-like predicted oxidoreductase